jgi:integrase
MARPRKTEIPTVRWRQGRAWADFRAYSDVGGDRESLCLPGDRWGTTDKDIADTLLLARVNELRAERKRRAGVPQAEARNATLEALTRDHLLAKANAGISDSHLFDLESRLKSAIAHFGQHRDPRTITPTDVRAWQVELEAGGKRKPGTVRHYLNALSGLYGRAQEQQVVEPGYNPVAALVEKPTGRYRSEAAFFEVHDAALILEAARVVEARGTGGVGAGGNRANATPGLYAIVATMLLTGGRKAEVLGLDVEDVSFDRAKITFRPNRHRGLKTRTSERTVPLWPQLRAILQAHLFGGDSPRTTGLLFPGPHGGMVKDLRKSLDAVAALCGVDSIRTKAFRHTYCSARLQTVQRIVRPGADPATDPNPYEWLEVSRFTVQKEMGHGGAQLVDRIYGHATDNPHRSEVVEYRVEQHAERLGDRLRAVR